MCVCVCKYQDRILKKRKKKILNTTHHDSYSSSPQPSFNMAEYHQLFVGTERLRCPELLFQPSLIGEDQMGLMETLQYVLARYSDHRFTVISPKSSFVPQECHFSISSHLLVLPPERAQVHAGAAGGAGEQRVSDRGEHAVPRHEGEGGEGAAGDEAVSVALQGTTSVRDSSSWDSLVEPPI